MPYFTRDNTAGFTDAELAELNRRFTAEMRDCGLDRESLEYASHEKNVADRLLTSVDLDNAG